jgi:hypothetical protein
MRQIDAHLEQPRGASAAALASIFTSSGRRAIVRRRRRDAHGRVQRRRSIEVEHVLERARGGVPSREVRDAVRASEKSLFDEREQRGVVGDGVRDVVRLREG